MTDAEIDALLTDLAPSGHAVDNPTVRGLAGAVKAARAEAARLRGRAVEWRPAADPPELGRSVVTIHPSLYESCQWGTYNGPTPTNQCGWDTENCSGTPLWWAYGPPEMEGK